MSETIAVGTRVRTIWPSVHDGMLGPVTAIDGRRGRLLVCIDGERWRNMVPILVSRHEVQREETT